MEMDDLSGRVIRAAIEVHRALGPGLLESVYQQCLSLEIQESGLCVEREVVLPVEYKGLRFDSAFRIDLLVEGVLAIELKAVENVLPVHRAQ
jgi:GxxExxY protein